MRQGSLVRQPFDPTRLQLGGEPQPFSAAVWFAKNACNADFSMSEDGRVLVHRGPPLPTRLVWFDRTGREAGSVGDPASLSMPRISPDGRRVVFALWDPREGTRDLWVHELGREMRTRLTTDPFSAVWPIWSPDGGRIAFSSVRSGPPRIHLRRAEPGGDEQALFPTEGVQLPRDWSPDGRSILFDNSPARPPRQLQLLPVDAGPPVPAQEPSAASRYLGRFAPDGRTLAFVSEESGRPEVYLAPLGGGTRHQVSPAGGSHPRWRRDGRELFYLSLDGRLMAAPLGPGPGYQAGTPVGLFALPASPRTEYEVAPDGQRFLVHLGGEGEPPIVVSVGDR